MVFVYFYWWWQFSSIFCSKSLNTFLVNKQFFKVPLFCTLPFIAHILILHSAFTSNFVNFGLSSFFIIEILCRKDSHFRSFLCWIMIKTAERVITLRQKEVSRWNLLRYAMNIALIFFSIHFFIYHLTK